MKTIGVRDSRQTVRLFFLYFAALFILNVCISFVTSSGYDFDLVRACMISLVSGFGLSVFFTAAQLFGVRSRSRKILRDSMSVRPTAEYGTRAAYAAVVQQCAGAIQHIRGVRSWNVDTQRGVITASVGMSMVSWGEHIRVEIRSVPEGTIVRVSSAPKLPVTLVDYGKNLRNVETVLRYLRSAEAGSANSR
jgi:hypothetical protein